MEKFEFNSICRLCVRQVERGKFSPIFNNEMYADEITLPERIKYCSSLEVTEGDGLPCQICSSCLLKLNQSFIFRKQCILANVTLRRLVNDDSVKVDELTDLLKIDIENEIIKSENSEQNKIIEENQNETKNDVNFDEFDNSKNGRHIKNINKLEDKLMQRTQILENKSEKASEFFEYLTLNSRDKTLSNPPSPEVDNIKKKKKSKKESLSEEKPARAGKRLLRGKKETNNVENATVMLDTGSEKESNSEDCSVEPDIFNFIEVEESENCQSEMVQVNLGDYAKKLITKVVKPKSLGMKRGGKKKLAVVKEKPTSYTCDYCQKVYPSEGGWRYHIHTMHNENYQPFICDLCGQAFKVKKNLEGHKNSIHFHLKLNLCDLCGRGFASKYALKVHKIWHSDEKNFACDVCGMKFRTRSKMNTHKSIHGGPKKFMCHICSRDFRWKKDFEIHVRTHTGEKPFKCAHCGKAFASLTNMKKHERNHLEKYEKRAESFDVMSSTNDVRLFRSEILDFGYGSEDVRNRQIDQI